MCGKQHDPISHCHLQVRKGARVMYFDHGSGVQFDHAVIARGELGSFYRVCDNSARFLDDDVCPIL